METKINLAGTILHISGPDADMFSDYGVLTPFVTEEDRTDLEVNCIVVDEFPDPPEDCIFHNASRWEFRDGGTTVSYMGTVGDSPRNAYIVARRKGKQITIHVKRNSVLNRISPKTLLYGLEAEHVIARNRGVLFHCSFIEHEDGAILFTAPSGVGKSTQAELWHQHRNARVINGDRAVVRIGDYGAEAWGVPYCGSSGISHQCCLPLRAIVCLAQAHQTSISILGGVRAFRQIWEGCSVHTWNREDVALSSETVMNIVNQVPVFHLACTPDESAVVALEQALSQIQR